jgi:hypothetical protein
MGSDPEAAEAGMALWMNWVGTCWGLPLGLARVLTPPLSGPFLLSNRYRRNDSRELVVRPPVSGVLCHSALDWSLRRDSLQR